MSPRALAGLALWLSLALLPVAHLGVRPLEWLAVVLPLCLLPVRRAAIAFLAALLPLYVLRPDLVSPRAHGIPGIFAQCALVVAYLVVALADVPLGGGRHRARPTWDLGRWLTASAAVILALALAAPYLPDVAGALRRSYPASTAAAGALLAAGCLALGAGVVLVYVAAPLQEAGRRRP